MTNSPWTLCSEAPPPDGETVLVRLEKPRLGSLYAIHSSRKISNGYMRVINGLFDFDFSEKIVAWRRLDDLEQELPLSITEGD